MISGESSDDKDSVILSKAHEVLQNDSIGSVVRFIHFVTQQ